MTDPKLPPDPLVLTPVQHEIQCVSRLVKDCDSHPGYEHGVKNMNVLGGAAAGCDECMLALIKHIGVLEPVKRLEILRYFLKDQTGTGAKMDDQGVRHYMGWCAYEALLESFRIHDHNRGVIRRMMTKLDIVKEPGEEMRDAFVRLGFLTLGSIMIEKTEMEMYGSFLDSPKQFREWFEENLILPIIAHENECLAKSGGKVIQVFNKPQIYLDRIAEIYRFKTWEVAAFPGAAEPVKETA